ncbi:MAG: S8 family serine peptidase, partial [Bacteroidota bacterium]
MKRLLYPLSRMLFTGIVLSMLPKFCLAQVNVNDSLALVQLYQQTAGDDWNNNSNWLAGPVNTWFGITVDPGSQRVVDIQLPNNNLQGMVPTDLLNLNGLLGIDIPGNFVEAIPNFSLLPNIMAMNVADNQLTFEDLEPFNFGVFNSLNYAPQKPVGIACDTIAEVGTTFQLQAVVGGTANDYFWLKDGLFFTQLPANSNGILPFDPVACSDQGLYQAQVGSAIVPDLFIDVQPKLMNTVGLDSLGAPYRCNQIIVQWDSSATDVEKDTMRTFFSATYADSVLCGNIELWGLPDTVFLSDGDSLVTIEEIVSKTKEKSKIEEVDLNYLADIESFNSHYQKLNSKPNQLMSFYAPHSASMDTVLAAIIDTGVDIDHDALSDYLWFNTDEVVNLTDNDGNCIPDDINGYDFVDKETSVDDENSHGSHVGGLMLEGLAPMSDDVDLIILQTHDEFGGGDIFQIISAIYYATSKGAEVINISSGYSGGIAEILGNAIADARDKNGAIVVCSAGNQSINNDTLTHYPSSFPLDNLLSVGALNIAEDSIAAFSNYGQTSVDLFAPGSGILSAVPGNLVAEKSGTSMSAAIVSNAVILMKQAAPIASYPEIISCILSTATVENDLD